MVILITSFSLIHNKNICAIKLNNDGHAIHYSLLIRNSYVNIDVNCG